MSVVIALVRISCTLSIFGSLVVMGTCSAQRNKKRRARQLLFWLSVSDMFSSIVYIFADSPFVSNKSFCEAAAALGIIFPVASFLWTDVICFYLYNIIVNRLLQTEKEWNRSLFCAHCLVWSISVTVGVVVVIFRHAGLESSTDTGEETNDDFSQIQWCWITAGDATELFIWEIIGGKGIEWMSSLFIALFYALSIKKLYRMKAAYNDGSRSSSSNLYTSLARDSYHLVRYEQNSGALKEGLVDPLLVVAPDTDTVPLSPSQSLLHPYVSHTMHETAPRPSCDARPVQPLSHFSFYLFLVPFVFFFIRLWSTLRMIVLYAAPSSAGVAIDSLSVLQAFFDPSQGFFNFILFVMTSSQERKMFFDSLLFPLALTCGTSSELFKSRGKSKNSTRDATGGSVDDKIRSVTESNVTLHQARNDSSSSYSSYSDSISDDEYDEGSYSSLNNQIKISQVLGDAQEEEEGDCT